MEKLLDFGRKAILQREQIDSLPWLAAEVEELRKQTPAPVQILLDLPAGCSPVNADPSRLAEVIHNLVLNAQDALPDGGAISITMGNVQAEACCAVCQQPVRGQWVRLAVADDGQGIEPANLPRVFEPFFTTRSPLRNGLGLSQIVGIVKQHDGHIEVLSEVGAGTVVSIYLPPARTLLRDRKQTARETVIDG